MATTYNPIGVENIAISYSSPNFTIHGTGGRTLSTSNPGYVTLPSKSSPGDIIRIPVTANQSFIDDNGASEIIGNLFGLTTGIAYAQDIPFYIYAVINDAEDAIQFMIARIPHATTSPSAANIGAPDDPVSDTGTSFWSLDNIDETLYDQNPCICVGSFRMRMSASDDWTVQTLDNRDGINQFQETREFTQVAGHFGAASGKFWADNGGTAPSFSTNTISYFISKTGWMNYTALYLTATPGVTSVTAQAALPLSVKNTAGGFGSSARYFDSSTSTFSIGYSSPNPNTTLCTFVIPAIDAAGSFDNPDFDTSDQIIFTINYPIGLPS